MISVTEEAKRELKRIIENRDIEHEKFLRLAIPPVWTGVGDFGIVIDEQRPEDIAITYGELKVLLIESGVSEGMSSGILDFKESPDGFRFTLDVY